MAARRPGRRPRTSRRSPSRRCGRSSASARRRSRPTALRLRRGDELRHGEERRRDRAVAVSHGIRRVDRAPKPRRLTAGDKDSDPKWSPDGRLDRVHREAQGRRRAADLPDRARRRRGAAADERRHRRVGDQVVSRRQADRVRLVGVAGSRDRRGAGEAAARSARTRRSRRTSPSAPNSASGTTG